MNKMLMKFLMIVIIMTTTMIMMTRMTTMKRMTRQCEWIWNNLFSHTTGTWKHVFFSQGIHFLISYHLQTSSKCRPTSISQRSSFLHPWENSGFNTPKRALKKSRCWNLGALVDSKEFVSRQKAPNHRPKKVGPRSLGFSLTGGHWWPFCSPKKNY